MSDELVKQEPATLMKSSDPAIAFHMQWNRYMEIARTVAKAGMLNKNWDSAEKIMMGFMKCHELGLPVMTGITSMFVVNGKVSIEVNLMRAIIDSSGECEKKEITEGEGFCKVFTRRKKDGQEFTSMFTIAEARTAKLLDKDNWKYYPKDMLRARAEAINYRQQFSHLLYGMVYTPDELSTIDVYQPDGSVVVVSYDEGAEFKRINEKLREMSQKPNLYTPDDIMQYMLNNAPDIDKMSEQKRASLMFTYHGIVKKFGEKYVIARHSESNPKSSTDTASNSGTEFGAIRTPDGASGATDESVNSSTATETKTPSGATENVVGKG